MTLTISRTFGCLALAAVLFFSASDLCVAQKILTRKYKVTVEPDSIMAGEEPTTVTVHANQKDLKLTLMARRGGGEYGDFKYVQTSGGGVYQTTFKTRFPGEIDLFVMEVKDTGYDPVGQTILTVFGPSLLLDYDFNINTVEKSMGITVDLTDFRERPIEGAEFDYKIYSVKGKRKSTKSGAKLDPFVFKDGKYHSKFRFTEYGDYEIHVWDKVHFGSYFDAGEEVRDNPHPFDKILGLTIELE